MIHVTESKNFGFKGFVDVDVRFCVYFDFVCNDIYSFCRKTDFVKAALN